MCLKDVCMADSVDPDQMPHSAASDLGLQCLQRPVHAKLGVKMTDMLILEM